VHQANGLEAVSSGELRRVEETALRTSLTIPTESQPKALFEISVGEPDDENS